MILKKNSHIFLAAILASILAPLSGCSGGVTHAGDSITTNSKGASSAATASIGTAVIAAATTATTIYYDAVANVTQLLKPQTNAQIFITMSNPNDKIVCTDLKTNKTTTYIRGQVASVAGAVTCVDTAVSPTQTTQTAVGSNLSNGINSASPDGNAVNSY
jgi:hypothetical protein